MTDVCGDCGKECVTIKEDLFDRQGSGILNPHKCKELVKSSKGESNGI